MGILDLSAGGFDVTGGADSSQHVIEILAELRHPVRQLIKTLFEGRPRHRDRCVHLLSVGGPRITEEASARRAFHAFARLWTGPPLSSARSQ